MLATLDVLSWLLRRIKSIWYTYDSYDGGGGEMKIFFFSKYFKCNGSIVRICDVHLSQLFIPLQ